MSNQAAQNYASSNLAGCAQECLQWRKKGRFDGPHLRELARLLQPDFPNGDEGDLLANAERLVTLTALQVAAAQAPTPVPDQFPRDDSTPPAARPRG